MVIAEQTGIPVARLTSDARQKLQGMQETLSRRVMGQPAAIEKITRMVTMARAGLRNPNRPSGVLLFVGPTGVGKTELSRALAEFLFGSESEMIRFDMSEFKEKHSVSRLIGAPPGYIGHDEEGELTGRLRSKPYSVVLFDEVEKAHPEILDLFLQLFDAARITDSHGRTVDARNAIFIMTCNAVEPSRRLGFRVAEDSLPISPPSDSEENLSLLIKELGSHFRREFLNRVDEIVLFNPLTAESIRQIAISLLNRLADSMRSQGHTVEFTPEAVDLIARTGCDPKNGARPIARAIDRLIAAPLSEELLRENIAAGDHLTVAVRDGKILFLRSSMEDDAAHTK
jgi:ATP-dependent Clp protease ATP-binding subunit ClpA